MSGYRSMPWPNEDGVATLRAPTTYYVETECESCAQRDWPGLDRVDSPSLSAARKRAHRHVRATGHTVRVFQMIQHTYGPQESIR